MSSWTCGYGPAGVEQAPGDVACEADSLSAPSQPPVRCRRPGFSANRRSPAAHLTIMKQALLALLVADPGLARDRQRRRRRRSSRGHLLSALQHRDRVRPACARTNTDIRHDRQSAQLRPRDVRPGDGVVVAAVRRRGRRRPLRRNASARVAGADRRLAQFPRAVPRTPTQATTTSRARRSSPPATPATNGYRRRSASCS